MTRDQNVEHSAATDVVLYFEREAAKLQGRPTLAGLLATLKSNCNLVKANMQVQMNDKSSVTAEKNAVRDAFEPYLKRQLRISLGFFETLNLPGPKKEAADLLEALNKAQEAELFTVANGFVALLTPYLQQSAEMGITENSLKKIADTTETLMAIVESLGNEKTSRPLATANIDRLLKANKALLRNQIDYLMEDFAETDPDCYATYHRLRKFNYVRRHRAEATQGVATTASATIRVVDATGGQPIAGATLAIDGQMVNDVTDEFGELEVEGLGLTQHELTATAQGYGTVTQIVSTATAGEGYTFEMELGKTS
jgi:hypothetical protein